MNSAVVENNESNNISCGKSLQTVDEFRDLMYKVTFNFLLASFFLIKSSIISG